MLSEVTKSRLFPRISEALTLGRNCTSNPVGGMPNCQLSQGVHLIDQQTLIDRAVAMKMHIWPDGRGTNLFAVKGQPNHWVLKTLLDVGFGLDCSSPTEIWDALAVGVKADKNIVMYTANATPWEHLDYALGNGAILNLDDECYLDVLGNAPRTISFRVNLAKMRQDGQSKIIGKATKQKYGVPIARLIAAFSQAKAMGVKNFGLHTMYSSNCRDWRTHAKTLEILLGLALQLEAALGIRLKFINAGGGIGVDYKHPNDPSIKYGDDDKPFDLERYGLDVSWQLSEFERVHGWRPDLYLECARYVAAPAGILVAPIIAITQKYRRFACMAACDGADLLRAGIYPAHHHIIVLDKDFREVVGRKIIKQSIVGPLCENIHAVSQRLLPEIIPGDHVVFCDAGCHGIEMGMNYNGWTKSGQVMLLTDGSLQLISRPQTVADIRSLQVPLP